ncbi:hypothetical protein CCR82_09760 [Halochromatium salexigens]|uniref:Thioredoxin domain-containing protein n=1 Tax=Halochromatium salexigens TaxID=49447 RepID=A0AAJ0UG35_HALSE|nr:hypothetical protein [Halochromatium salexigens]
MIMALAAVGLFLVGYQWGNQFQREHEAPLRIDGVLMRAPVALPAFETLRGPQGTITHADLRGHWSLIAFGSPGSAAGHRGVARLIEIANRVADQPEVRQHLQLLLISADDAPRLARDFERLTPNLSVLSTSQDEFERLQQALGAGGDGDADTDADAADHEQPPPLFLIGPQARLVALFPGSQPAAQIAADLARLAERPDAFPPATEPDDA